jgi:hypothetical protein
MNKQELIEKYKSYEGKWGAPGAELARQIFIEDLKLLDEPETGHADEAPRYVKNILARLRELPVHDRKVWLKAIMGEFDGVFEHEKVKIPQFVADWIEQCKAKRKRLLTALLYTPEKVNSWVDDLDNQKLFARAYLDGYEVEKEPKYTVRMKGVSGYTTHLNKNLDSQNWFFASKNEIYGYRVKHTRKELEDAGFGWVFDSPGIEIKEA